ncbi:MAG: TlpA disulfide reductase family protein [candidate division WOR-3 bacterium]
MKYIIIIISTIFLIISCVKTKSPAVFKDTDFTLEKIDGGTITLSQLKKKVILIDFWATWCPPCQEAIPHLVDLYDKYKDKGLAILGISLDQNKEAIPPFINEYKINYPILLGNQEVAKKYQIQGIPTFFVFDRSGNIVYKEVGFSEKSKSQLEIKIKELLEQ